MKVFTEIQELIGKKVYHDKRLDKLKERFNPPKVTFYSVEFTDKFRDSCLCTVTTKEKALDLIIADIEKAETVSRRLEDKAILEKALSILNNEKFLYNQLEKVELALLKECAFITAKAVIIFAGQQIDALLEEIFSQTHSVFFFAAGKKEARSWLIDEGTDIVNAASKIHTDLARGFIRAEIYNTKDLDSFKNLTEAKQRGILKIVDKTYIVQDGDVLDIKFNV